MRTVIAAILLVSLPVVADPAKTAAQMHDDDCAKARAAKRECVIDMTGEEVDGHGMVPNGTATTIIKFTQHSSLIHIRRDFIVEMLKTAEQL
jgi:hypothetical protein